MKLLILLTFCLGFVACIPQGSYRPAPEPTYGRDPEPAPEPTYGRDPEPAYKPAPKRKSRRPRWTIATLCAHKEKMNRRKNWRRPSYCPGSEPSYGPAPEPSYTPAPEPSYVRDPEPTYERAPEPSYETAPEPSYGRAPEPSYRGNNNLNN